VEREANAKGIRYSAGENAAPFLASVESKYLLALKDRAAWLVNELGDLSDEQFRANMRDFFAHWVEEFQAIEQSLGTDT
jgi:type VI protein secretion system component VasF